MNAIQLCMVLLIAMLVTIMMLPAPNPTKKICKEGVYYYSGRSRMSPAYNTDGTLQLCSVQNN